MSAIDTVKDVVRIATTAGLAKDVIDLLEKKATLLAEQVVTAEKENTTLLRENRNLHLINEDLRKQVENAKPKGDRLDDDCNKMLVYIANSDGIVLPDLLQWLGVAKVQGQHTFDQLMKRDFVKAGLFGTNKGFPFHTTPTGREYMAKESLLNARPDRPRPPRAPDRPSGFNSRRML